MKHSATYCLHVSLDEMRVPLVPGHTDAVGLAVVVVAVEFGFDQVVLEEVSVGFDQVVLDAVPLGIVNVGEAEIVVVVSVRMVDKCSVVKAVIVIVVVPPSVVWVTVLVS